MVKSRLQEVVAAAVAEAVGRGRGGEAVALRRVVGGAGVHADEAGGDRRRRPAEVERVVDVRGAFGGGRGCGGEGGAGDERGTGQGGDECSRADGSGVWTHVDLLRSCAACWVAASVLAAVILVEESRESDFSMNRLNPRSGVARRQDTRAIRVSTRHPLGPTTPAGPTRRTRRPRPVTNRRAFASYVVNEAIRSSACAGS